MRADVPPLTVTLIGNRWKSHVNIHVLMQDRTLEDVRKFVRLYLQKMQYSEANLEALRSIADWFSPALEAAKEQWVQATLCDIAETPLFMKDSLRELMGDDFKQEFPWEVNSCEH